MIGYSQNAVSRLSQTEFNEPVMALAINGIVQDLNHFTDLAKKVIDQTERRVLKGESMPASEKVLSIFEPHTDIIIKEFEVLTIRVNLEGGI